MQIRLFDTETIPHRSENNPESQAILNRCRKAFEGNNKKLLEHLLKGLEISSADCLSKLGFVELRRRIKDLIDNGVKISYRNEGAMKVWYMSEDDLNFNK